MYVKEYYSVAKTVWKFAKACGIFGSGAAATAMFPDESAGLEQWLAFLALCLPPIIEAARNFWKHRDKIGGKVTYSGYLLFIGAAGLALSGCAGITPAFGGKTNYLVEFSDTTADQDTRYKMDIRAPAGVDLASVTGMTYDWRPDGSGAIAVSNDGTVSTQGQAALQAQYTAQQFEAFGQLLQTIAPLIGAKIQSDAAQPPPVDAISAAEIRALLEAMAEAKK